MRWVTLFSNREAAEKALAPNTLRRVRIGELRICLARTEDGWFAIDDACPHRQVSLSDGHLNYLGEVVCPLHNYCYSMKSGQECQARTADAETYPLRWEAGSLQLGLGN